MYEENPEIAVMTAIEIDPEAWEKTVEQIATQIAAENEIQDPQMKRAFEIFLEQRDLEMNPADRPYLLRDPGAGTGGELHNNNEILTPPQVG